MIAAVDLAVRLGAKRSARTFRCDCPACAYPNSFSIRQNHDGRARVWCANGCPPETLNATLKQIVGGDWTPPSHPAAADAEKQRVRQKDRALREWAGSASALGTLAAVYLTWRGLPDLAASDALRFRGDATHPEGGRLPALIAKIVDVIGQHIADHRTYLARDGQGKANITPSKASLGPLWGGAIRLQPYEPGKPLIIGEGIETAASAGLLMGFPAWAAISAGNMAKGLILPPDVRHVIIATDPDPPGERAAKEAAARWQKEGRRVQFAKPTEKQDFNDLLRAGGQHG
jgi:putative DNA primase/helicase